MRLELVGIMLSVLAQSPPSAPHVPRVFKQLFIPATTPGSLATLDADPKRQTGCGVGPTSGVRDDDRDA
jgi:hypothetical protein